MDAAFPALIGHPFEMLDHVGHVHMGSIDPNLSEQLSSRADKGASG